MNINNIYNNISNRLQDTNIYYSVMSNMINMSSILLAIKDNKILKYSNEWLYLLNHAYYPNQGPYREIVQFFNNMNNNIENATIINEKVLTFITSFSYGTVHGYSGFYHILFNYLKNKNKYENHKILFLSNSQSGLKQILQNAINKKLIDSDKIIYIDPDKIYLIKELCIIPNKYHNIMGTELADNIFDYVKKYISIMKNIKNYKRFDLNVDLKNVCLIKTNSSNNTNIDGMYNYQNLIDFSKKNNVFILNPGKMHEIGIILAINTCKIFICSWGTAFMKNYCYISDNCKKIVVLVHKKKYLSEYNNHIEKNAIVNKFRNAKIVYKIRDDLDFIFDQ